MIIIIYEIFSATHTTYLQKQMLENMKYNSKTFYLYIQIGRLFVPWVSYYTFFIRSETMHKLKL